MTGTPETITRDELEAYYKRMTHGDGTLTEGAADRVFASILAHREPEYEPGEIYEDTRGFRYFRKPAESPFAADLPWVLIGRDGTIIERVEDTPDGTLRKLAPEGSPLSENERDVINADLSTLIDVLGLDEHVRPGSPHEVFVMCIDEVIRMAGGRAMTDQQPEAPAVPGVTRWRTPPAPPGVIREAIRLASGNLPDVAAWVRSHGQECQDDGADLLIGSPGDYIRAVPGEWVIRNPDSYWGFGHDVMPAEAFTATYEPAPGPLVLPAGEFSLVRMLAERTGLAEPSGDAPDPLPEGSAPPEGNAAKTSVSFGGETAGTPVRWDDGTYRHAACDTAIVGLRARAEAAEAKLAAIGKQCGKAAEVLRRGTGVPFSQMDVMVDARYILEIIGSEEAGHA